MTAKSTKAKEAKASQNTEALSENSKKPQQMSEADIRANREKQWQELVDLAEKCRRDGNMEGYRGYMSAAGDIGR